MLLSDLKQMSYNYNIHLALSNAIKHNSYLFDHWQFSRSNDFHEQHFKQKNEQITFSPIVLQMQYKSSILKHPNIEVQ